jgi:hypothetical protein
MNNNDKLCVVLNIDFGSQMLAWTPQITVADLEEWFRGLTSADLETLWFNPRALPGRMVNLVLSECKPTHVLCVEGKHYAALGVYYPEHGASQTIIRKDFSDD